jgi:hypothetical protein
MKSTKILILAAALLSGAAFAQNGAFIYDQPVMNNTTFNNARSVNPRGDVVLVDENPSAKTITITYKDGTVDNWTYGTSADYWTVLDRFVTGTRSQGNDFYYTNVNGSNAHRRIPYTAVRKVTCAVTQPVGGDFYTATITLTNGSIVVSNGFSMTYCANFN